jgi:hypothetical protein
MLLTAGCEVIHNKIIVNSEELAILQCFISSPTIRINGQDIEAEVKRKGEA